MKKLQFLPMNLQFFAEPEDKGNGDPADPADPKEKDKPVEDPKPPVDSDKKYSDADLDQIINQKFAKWQKDKDEEIRQSKLTADEKEQERIKKLEKLERDVASRDAKDKARQALSDAKLPSDFADFVFDTQEDVAKDKLDKFTKTLAAYRESVVNEIMRDKTPKKPKNDADGKVYDLAHMKPQELRELREKDPEKFKEITQK